MDHPAMDALFEASLTSDDAEMKLVSEAEEKKTKAKVKNYTIVFYFTIVALALSSIPIAGVFYRNIRGFESIPDLVMALIIVCTVYILSAGAGIVAISKKLDKYKYQAADVTTYYVLKTPVKGAMATFRIDHLSAIRDFVDKLRAITGYAKADSNLDVQAVALRDYIVGRILHYNNFVPYAVLSGTPPLSAEDTDFCTSIIAESGGTADAWKYCPNMLVTKCLSTPAGAAGETEDPALNCEANHSMFGTSLQDVPLAPSESENWIDSTSVNFEQCTIESLSRSDTVYDCAVWEKSTGRCRLHVKNGLCELTHGDVQNDVFLHATANCTMNTTFAAVYAKKIRDDAAIGYTLVDITPLKTSLMAKLQKADADYAKHLPYYQQLINQLIADLKSEAKPGQENSFITDSKTFQQYLQDTPVTAFNRDVAWPCKRVEAIMSAILPRVYQRRIRLHNAVGLNGMMRMMIYWTSVSLIACLVFYGFSLLIMSKSLDSLSWKWKIVQLVKENHKTSLVTTGVLISILAWVHTIFRNIRATAAHSVTVSTANTDALGEAANALSGNVTKSNNDSSDLTSILHDEYQSSLCVFTDSPTDMASVMTAEKQKAFLMHAKQMISAFDSCTAVSNPPGKPVFPFTHVLIYGYLIIAGLWLAHHMYYTTGANQSFLLLDEAREALDLADRDALCALWEKHASRSIEFMKIMSSVGAYTTIVVAIMYIVGVEQEGKSYRQSLSSSKIVLGHCPSM